MRSTVGITCASREFTQFTNRFMSVCGAERFLSGIFETSVAAGTRNFELRTFRSRILEIKVRKSIEKFDINFGKKSFPTN